MANQRFQNFKDRTVRSEDMVADRFGRLDGKPSVEHSQALPGIPRGRVKQVDTPGERAAHRLKPGRLIGWATGEQRESPPESVRDRFWRQQVAPGGRQLDRQRQAIQSLADADHRRRIGICQPECRVGRTGPCDEKLDRLMSRKLSHIKLFPHVRQTKWFNVPYILT